VASGTVNRVITQETVR
jgi:hypothetical protein